MGRLPLVHAFGTVLIDDPLGIAHDDVVGFRAHGLDQFDAGNGGGAGAVDHHFGLIDVPSGQVQGVDQPGGGNDGGAVLVIVEHGNIHDFAQPLLNDEALRRPDVFQVDAAEGGPQEPYAIDELVHVPGVDFQIDAIHVGETLEQNRLALHHRLGRLGAQIPQAQYGGAVGNHRHQAALGGVVIGKGWIPLDLQAGRRHPWRIGQRQVPLGGQRLCGADFKFSRPPRGVHQQGFLIEGLVCFIVHGVKSVGLDLN